MICAGRNSKHTVGGDADTNIDMNRARRKPSEDDIRRLAAYYDQQSDEDGAKEIDNARAARATTWIEVPSELLPEVRKLIARRKKSA